MTGRDVPAARLANTRLANARLALVAVAMVSIAVYWVPGLRALAYPLELLATLVHELGHGTAALLVGGRFHRLRVWPDGSGIADLAVPASVWAQAFVAGGGLLGPPWVAALLFWAGRRRRGARRALAAIALLLLVALILVVRNVFGALLVVLIGGVCWAVSRVRRGELPRLVALLLAVQMALSALARGGELFAAQAQTAGGTLPSDVAQIARALGGPPWFWGMVVAVLSISVLGVGLTSFWRTR